MLNQIVEIEMTGFEDSMTKSSQAAASQIYLKSQWDDLSASRSKRKVSVHCHCGFLKSPRVRH